MIEDFPIYDDVESIRENAEYTPDSETDNLGLAYSRKMREPIQLTEEDIKKLEEAPSFKDYVESRKPRVKQCIVVRRDLKMRRGKECAQVSHASMKWLIDKMEFHHHEDDGVHDAYILDITADEKAWIDGLFTKVVLKAESEEQLLEIYEKAKEAGLTVHLITDAGLTEFKGVETNTCLAIGPTSSENVDPITKDLQLM